MKKGYIKIPINEVWEITNKPHRFFRSLYEEVEKLELGEYQFLYFSQDEKDEIIKRIKEVDEVFNNRWRKIPSKLKLRIGVYKMYISDFFYRLTHLYDTDDYYNGFEDGYTVAKRNYKNLNVNFLRQWLNEDRITDENKMVSNEQIMEFIKRFN